MRSDCGAITSPVAGSTICWDTTALAWKLYGGATFTTVSTVNVINIASAVFTNALPVVRASATSANLMSVRSISATQTQGNNLRGSCTFSASNLCVVAFASNEPDANYFVALGGQATTNANTHAYVVDTKAVSGFNIRATISNSNTVDWILIH